MAGQAGYLKVFAEQWVVCLGMVKRLREARLLPRQRCVTGSAFLLELALVRISMTVGAFCEWYAFVAGLTIRARRVATLARYVPMRAGERVGRLRMVKMLTVDTRCLPVDGRMAVRAIGPKAALVWILMAGSATRRQAKPGPIQIFTGEQCARLSGDVLHIVARAATHANMLAVESISRLGMVESARSRIPVHHLEINPVVVGVALYACGARRCGTWKSRMKPFVLLDLGGDFPMALETPKYR
jgi:hypothetical protein